MARPRWLRHKLTLGLALVVGSVFLLLGGTFYGIRSYFATVQTKTVKYRPLMAPSDQPATWLNAEKMARFRDEMRKYYYDPSKYDTYLQQLGIKYPTVPTTVP